MIWLGFVLGVLVTLTPAQADTCRSLIATTFGAKGSLTVSIDRAGKMVQWQDGFVTEGTRRIPRFSQVQSSVDLGTIGSLHGFAINLINGANQQYSVVVDTDGILKLISPLGFVYPIRVLDEMPVDAADLRSNSLRDYQQGAMPIKGLQMQTTVSQRDLRKQSQVLEESAERVGFHVVLATGNSLYKVSFSPRYIEDEAMSKELILDGIMKGNSEAFLEGPEFIPQPTRLIDLTSGERFLIPTLSPELALEVSGMERLATITNENLISTINYLKMLDSHRAVVASQIGQVLVLDFARKKILHAVSFPSLAWVKGVSAHLNDTETEIWAINQSDKTVYHWNSSWPHFTFKPLPPLGDGTVTPESLATHAEKVPLTFSPGPTPTEGLFSNYRLLHDEIGVERILVLGSDGHLYAWAEGENVGVVSSADSERRWVRW